MVQRLRRRLRRHRVWDRLLAVLPPVGVVAYVCAALVARELAGPAPVVFVLAGVGAAALAALLHPGLARPSSHEAARLLDERMGAEDRFLTWTTLDRAGAHPAFVTRLREQVSALSRGVEPGRDFPYRARRGVMGSLLACGALAVLVHLSLGGPVRSTPDSTAAAEEGSAQFRLQGLAWSVKAGALGLWRRVEGGFGEGTVDGQASGLVRGGGGEGQGAQGQVPAGVRGAAAVASGQAGGSSAAAVASGQAGGPGAAAHTPGKGGERGHGVRGTGGSPGPRVSGVRGPGRGAGTEPPSRAREPTAKGAGGPGGGGSVSAGRGGAQGRQPDRFHPPGRGGEDGPEGARFVTVMLPRAPAVGAPRGVAPGSGGDAAVPFANAPLPPRRPPGLAAEIQRLPLEYRDLIE